MKHALTALLVAVGAMGCATAQDPKPAAAPAKAACAPAPKELVVKDLKPGSGTKVVGTRNSVLVTYTGWVYDGCAKDFKGAMFDSNASRQVPFGFMVGAGKVIKGWDEGLVGMKETGKRLLIIPADKAYGERAIGDKIPANSTLVFEVDLNQIAFQPGAAVTPAPKQ